jgi:putative nucleotidyltransferase with HDIG domain
MDTSNVHSPGEAFFQLINGIDKKDLDNLLEYILKYYLDLNPELNLSLNDCYDITQNLNLNKTEKDIIYSLAVKCVQDGKDLGTNVIANNINTSSWLAHSINVAQVCKILAIKTNLDDKCAEALGLLHDYGRKYSHKFDHTILGFEELMKLGWTNEAISCLTHSFLNGGRCSNNEPALEGFYVDNLGNPKWKKGTKKDDFTLFLESYTYSPYDYLLNIADLTATGSGIVPPHIRVADIATRRNIDPTNRSYFLCDLINTLIKLLNDCNSNTKNFEYIKAIPELSLEVIGKYFIDVSNEFYKVFFQEPKKTKKVVK